MVLVPLKRLETETCIIISCLDAFVKYFTKDYLHIPNFVFINLLTLIEFDKK